MDTLVKFIRMDELTGLIYQYLFVNQNILLTFAFPERRYVGNYDHYQRKRRRIIRQGSKTL